MHRNLDLNTLRTFVAVAESGGMTLAANRLHMTQSAISMQIKRLEEQLGTRVLDRSNRKVRPSAQGEQLLAYARRMLELNDEVWGRLTAPKYEGIIALGVPGDIVHPFLPDVLRTFNRDFPRSRVNLTTGLSMHLLQGLHAGKQDIVLTTETKAATDGETLCNLPLAWMGAHEGHAGQERPLPLSFTQGCTFRESAIQALDEAGIDWVDAIDTFDCDSTVVLSAADMAVTADLATWRESKLSPVPETAGLPALPNFSVRMYVQDPADDIANELAGYLRRAYSGQAAQSTRPTHSAATQ